jgi:hypothetical protein
MISINEFEVGNYGGCERGKGDGGGFKGDTLKITRDSKNITTRIITNQ